MTKQPSSTRSYSAPKEPADIIRAIPVPNIVATKAETKKAEEAPKL